MSEPVQRHVHVHLLPTGSPPLPLRDRLRLALLDISVKITAYGLFALAKDVIEALLE